MLRSLVSLRWTQPMETTQNHEHGHGVLYDATRQSPRPISILCILTQSIGIPIEAVGDCWDILKEVISSMPASAAERIQIDEQRFSQYEWTHGISKYGDLYANSETILINSIILHVASAGSKIHVSFCGVTTCSSFLILLRQ